jgi:hypothetical protein
VIGSCGGTQNPNQETRIHLESIFSRDFKTLRKMKFSPNSLDYNSWVQVDEFFNDLHVLATRMPELPDDCLLQISISGLKENIRNELK